MSNNTRPWWATPITMDHEKPIGRNADGQPVRKLWPPPGEWYGPGSNYGQHQIRHWDDPVAGAWAELARRLDAMGMVIVDSRDVPDHIARNLRASMPGAILSVTTTDLVNLMDPVAMFRPMDRFPGDDDPDPAVAVFMAEVARQVAIRWWAFPRSVRSVHVRLSTDVGKWIVMGDREVDLECLMIHHHPEVGYHSTFSRARILLDVMRDELEAGAAFLGNWGTGLIHELTDWAVDNGGRPWQPCVESRRDMEAEDRGYKEVSREG